MNKVSILKLFNEIPDNTSVVIDVSKTHFIHYDVCENIEDFKINAEIRNIKVEYINLYKNKKDKPLPHFEIKD